jgi:predicted secreted Zn-dependent protease
MQTWPSEDIEARVREVRYPVVGATAAELRDVMRVVGPRVGGHPFGAATRWEVTWTYGAVREATGFAVAAVRVGVDIEVKLPLWRPCRGTSEALVMEFAAYLAALRAHEEGHARVALGAGRSVRRALEAVSGAADLSSLHERAAAAAEWVLRHARHEEIAYDHATGHGQSQGVRLEPSPALDASSLPGGAPRRERGVACE